MSMDDMKSDAVLRLFETLIKSGEIPDEARHISDPDEAPENAPVITGPRGDMYYAPGEYLPDDTDEAQEYADEIRQESEPLEQSRMAIEAARMALAKSTPGDVPDDAEYFRPDEEVPDGYQTVEGPGGATYGVPEGDVDESDADADEWPDDFDPEEHEWGDDPPTNVEELPDEVDLDERTYPIGSPAHPVLWKRPDPEEKDEYKEQIQEREWWAEGEEAFEAAFHGDENTKDDYTDEDGNWDPEREQLHEEWAEELLNEDAVAEDGEPTGMILLGPPGAGKGWWQEQVEEGEYSEDFGDDQFTHISSDEAKKPIPEYDGANASEVHDEASKIGKENVAPEAVDREHNMMVDKVATTPDSTIRLAEAMQEAGFDLRATFVDVPEEKSMHNAVGRYHNEGRFTPLDYVDGARENSMNSFEELIDEMDIPDEKTGRFDNDVEWGDPPEVVEAGEELLKWFARLLPEGETINGYSSIELTDERQTRIERQHQRDSGVAGRQFQRGAGRRVRGSDGHGVTDGASLSTDGGNSILIGGVEVEVDVAVDDDTRYKGLSGRDSLGDDEGMLFVWPRNEKQSLIMRDMSFPIDVVWVGKSGEVVSTATLTEDREATVETAKYALELSAGFCDEHGVESGDPVLFPPEIMERFQLSKGEDKSGIIWTNVGGDPFQDGNTLENFVQALKDAGATEVFLGGEVYGEHSGIHDRPVRAVGMSMEDAERVWRNYEDDAVGIGGPQELKGVPQSRMEAMARGWSPTASVETKSRRYVDSEDEVPEGYDVQEGPEGGLYYEVEDSGGDMDGKPTEGNIEVGEVQDTTIEVTDNFLERDLSPPANTPEELNDGYCNAVAQQIFEELDEPEGARIMEASTMGGRHQWVEYNGEHFDAEATDGVEDFDSLPIWDRLGAPGEAQVIEEGGSDEPDEVFEFDGVDVQEGMTVTASIVDSGDVSGVVDSITDVNGEPWIMILNPETDSINQYPRRRIEGLEETGDMVENVDKSGVTPTRAFVHRFGENPEVYQKQDDEGGWVPYEGPQGGEGWEHTETGEVVYTDEPPGEMAEWVEDGQLREGVASLDDVNAGDEVAVGDKIYEVESVEKGPGGQQYARVEHEGEAFTVTEGLLDAKVLGEALQTGDYSVEQGTYGAELAEGLVQGGLTEQGHENFQNVRTIQHGLSDVENSTVLLDLLHEEASTRNSPTAVDRIKGRLSALDVPESEIRDAMPGGEGDVDLEELDPVDADSIGEGQEVYIDPDQFPQLDAPLEGTVSDVQYGTAWADTVYVVPEEEPEDYVRAGQVYEIDGEKYRVDRELQHDEYQIHPHSLEHAESGALMTEGDLPDDFDEQMELVEDVPEEHIPVPFTDIEESLRYKPGERPDNPYPAVGYNDAAEELAGQNRLWSGGGTKHGIENRDKIERIADHATDDELRDLIERANDPDDRDVSPAAGKAAGAILFKRGEGGIEDVVDVDSGDGEASVQEIQDSARQTFEKLDTTTAVALANHTGPFESKHFPGSKLGDYNPTSRKIRVDGLGDFSEDTVAHELGHSLHYLVGFTAGFGESDLRDVPVNDREYNAVAADLRDDESEQFIDDFNDWLDSYEERIKDKPTTAPYRLRDYQEMNTNEMFSVAFGEWIDNPSKLEDKQPELKELFEEYFGSGGDDA